jgi:UDP-N-acetylmuramoyl-L-alanyl-D-glutamate--2,6-diaminopimelate ligase
VIPCEVSSHALAQGRVTGTTFAVAAFTNLSQDHLDYHHDMESYFGAKARLFEQARRKVIWIEDPYGRRLADRYSDALLAGWQGDVQASSIDLYGRGSRFLLTVVGEQAEVKLPLAGRFNVANAVIAAGCAHAAGLPISATVAGLEGVTAVPGRFEIVDTGSPMTVVVDYAHTPEGVATVLETARSLTRGRVIVVFGAGGDRDRSKRPEMGRAASQADVVIVTSDNPRTENPESIIDELMSGVAHPGALRVTDRRQAIGLALAEAGSDDLVLILGKGHEAMQEIGTDRLPFDDRIVAREEWARIRESRDQR